MKELIDLIKAFEKRNNFSIVVEVYSDGSGNIEEFWSDKVIFRHKTTEQLEDYLKSEQYKFDEKGHAIDKPLIDLSGDKDNDEEE